MPAQLKTGRQVDVVSFNVNQFISDAKVAADLEVRMAGADVVGLVETVDFDLAAFAKKHPGRSAHQLDAGDNNGHANTSILFRTELGPVQDTACVFVGDAKDTRARYLIGVLLGGVWYVALHVFPTRDAKLIPAEIKDAGEWVHEQHEPIVMFLDKNQATPAALQKGTGLRWHGGVKDPTGGILTDLRVTDASEFKKGNSDHLGYAATVTVPAAPKARKPVTPPSPPYVGPTPHRMKTAGGKLMVNTPINHVTMHCTVGPCTPGAARAVAHMFNTSTRSASSHYVVDPSEAVQDVFDSEVAEHAPPNQHSIGIELCDPLVSVDWDHAHAARWQDAPHQAMLHRAARITARLCLSKGVPIHRLTVAELKAGRKGICGHVDVSNAFGETDHWDPGPSFPWAQFITMVERKAARLQGVGR